MLSKYAHSLPQEEGRRYLEKISAIRTTDSYVMTNLNSTVLPSIEATDLVNYLVLTTSSYTAQQFKSYRSLEAYNQFQCGWVQSVSGATVDNKYVVVGKPKSTGEQKTKPTQNSVRELRGLGLYPDLIICRSGSELSQDVCDKISNFCHVTPKQVICVPDVSSVYRVPLTLEEQNVVGFLGSRLRLPIPSPRPRKLLMKWKELADKSDRLLREVMICLVGKYTRLEDAYASMIKALNHAAMACNLKLDLKVIEMPEHHPGQLGGTMRLGKRKTNFRKEVPSLLNHSYFVAVQYHPEYLIRPVSPSPLYLGLILAASGKLQSYITHGCRLSPFSDFSDSDYSDDEQISEELAEFNLKVSSSTASLDSNVSAKK